MGHTADWVESRQAQRGLIRFDRALRDVTESAGAPLRQIHRDGVLQAGKRVRPLMVLLAGEFGSGSSSASVLMDVALAVELAHAGTLYHDDIADGARMRRCVPAVHARYGCRVAALAGAHLLYLANQLIGKHGQTLSRQWAATAGRVCEGQLREIEDIGDVGMSARRYLTHASLKTAALFAFAARAGADVASAGSRVSRSLERFAHSYGLLFQIVDDIADLFTRPEENGRESDMRLGIYNLPVVLALRNERGHELRALLESTSIPHPRPVVEEARSCVVALGAVDDALRIASRWATRARQACGDLPAGPARASLLRLTECTLNRGSALVAPARRGVLWARGDAGEAPHRVGRRTVLPGRLLGTLDFLDRRGDGQGGRLRIARSSGTDTTASFRGERNWMGALLEEDMAQGRRRSDQQRAVHAGNLACGVLDRSSNETSAAGLASRRDRTRWSFGTAQLAVADTLIATSFRLLSALPPETRRLVDAAMVEAFVGALRADECVRRGDDRVPGGRALVEHVG
jgi:heptaprenyl diphosphate synthase